MTDRAETVERCANCDGVIGRLEKAYVWGDRVVCGACFGRLQQGAAGGAGMPGGAVGPVSYATPPAGGENVMATLIPYRNVWALVSYYLGLFSLFPCLGCPMGITAVILGIKGLKVARENPQAKGKVHAIVGIVCGAVFGGLWTLAIVLWVVAMVMAPPR